MGLLDPYEPILTAKTAAHLLRRATFGPTQQEISGFIGLSAIDAVNILINNADYSIPEPVDLDSNSATKGQPYINVLPYNIGRNFWFNHYIRLWWIGIMARQSPPTLLDKLTLFWQNHFVTNVEIVNEYRFEYKYINLLRTNALGNFRYLVTEITKDSAMLKYLNGNDNIKGEPNENYARELQELFTVGEKDFLGNKNYTENDVKEVAKVLTGWKSIGYGGEPHGTYFDSIHHDESNKYFSPYYNNTTIIGRAGVSSGELELNDLVTMLLNHPETPKFICRKLYRWFVNSNVSPTVENNVIIPLAQFFASPSNNYSILPVIQKLLSCEHFFEEANIGAFIKSPADLIFGSMRFFNFPVPIPSISDVMSFFNYTSFCFYLIENMQMGVLKQPTVFGYEPYYQTGYSKVWINATTLGQRSQLTDTIVYGGNFVNENYNLKINLFALAASASNPSNAPAIVEKFTNNLFATGLNSSQKSFLVNTIMMMGLPITTWQFEYNAYLADPTNINKKNAVEYRLQTLMRYLLRMAEYQLC